MNTIAKTYSNQGLIAQWLQSQDVAGSPEGSGHAQGQGRWVSNEALAAGRWQLHIAIRAPGQEWAGASELQ
jgi:hypothetical protein